MSRNEPFANAGHERDRWLAARLRMEASGAKHSATGRSSGGRWMRRLIGAFGVALRGAGLHRRGVRNAAAVRLTELEVGFADLPPAFDGFRILHLTDLHVDQLATTTEEAVRIVAAREADLCVLTGDYRARCDGPFEHILGPLERLVASVRARHGVLGVLGNHDCASMVAPLERMGVRMLLNESTGIEVRGARLTFTGLDDVHHFFSQAALDALDRAPAGFKIALVHSPEVADHAAARGFRLYLCGHTHAGQVALPGGRPLVSYLDRCRRLARGSWEVDGMLGYTSSGVGVTHLPVRFNTRGEVALLRLRRTRRPGA